jgi:hypothetical protein
MDKERSGMMMEVYILEDSRIAAGLKGRSMSCKEITLTHFSL